MRSHAHIYGIDLASPSELIAHHRDENAIAEHIGAVKVIYQSLSDLKAACAELSPRKDQDFEVGVFCGTYITPVEDGYLEHLEEVRGATRKMKVMESARKAVASGSAGAEEVRAAMNGVKVNGDGTVVAVQDLTSDDRDTIGTVDQSRRSNSKRQRDEVESEVSMPPKDRMDISLHNFGDFTHESSC